jgi:hypothetical protein
MLQGNSELFMAQYHFLVIDPSRITIQNLRYINIILDNNVATIIDKLKNITAMEVKHYVVKVFGTVNKCY